MGFSWEQLRRYILLVSPIFSTGFQEFLHKHLLYTSLDFFPLDFLNIVLILHDVQVLKGECYNTNVK
jgi:hypothetical protein